MTTDPMEVPVMPDQSAEALEDLNKLNTDIANDEFESGDQDVCQEGTV